MTATTITVPCTRCAHPLEGHDTSGCGGCACQARWTRLAVMIERRRHGLETHYDTLLESE